MRLSLFNLFKPARIAVAASSAEEEVAALETVLPTTGNVGERPIRDEQHADRLIGATVLIGLTRVHPDGAQSQEQMFGVIRSANSRDGFEILLSGTRAGETYWLPPDPLKLVAAPSGEYRLRSTGEVVTDPDFTTSWIVEGSPGKLST